MPATPPILVMGVQGCGKSTISTLLAQRLAVPFIDADDLHPQANRDKMAAGHPLTDADRQPWLERVGQELAQAPDGVVIACSALRRSYRDLLRSAVPHLVLIYLRGDRALIGRRLAARTHDFMPPALLDSQFRTLEEPGAAEEPVIVDIDAPPDQVVETLLRALRARGVFPKSGQNGAGNRADRREDS